MTLLLYHRSRRIWPMLLLAALAVAIVAAAWGLAIERSPRPAFAVGESDCTGNGAHLVTFGRSGVDSPWNVVGSTAPWDASSPQVTLANAGDTNTWTSTINIVAVIITSDTPASQTIAPPNPASGSFDDSGPDGRGEIIQASFCIEGEGTGNPGGEPITATICKVVEDNADGIAQSGTFRFHVVATYGEAGTLRIPSLSEGPDPFLALAEGASGEDCLDFDVPTLLGETSLTSVTAYESTQTPWVNETGYPQYGEGTPAIADGPSAWRTAPTEWSEGDLDFTFINRLRLRTLTLCKVLLDDGDDTPGETFTFSFNVMAGGQTIATPELTVTELEPGAESGPCEEGNIAAPLSVPAAAEVTVLENAPESWDGNASGYPLWAPLDEGGSAVSESQGTTATDSTGTIRFMNQEVTGHSLTVVKADLTQAATPRTWRFEGSLPEVATSITGSGQRTIAEPQPGTVQVREINGRAAASCIPGVSSTDDYYTVVDVTVGGSLVIDDLDAGDTLIDVPVSPGTASAITFTNVSCGTVLGDSSITATKLSDADGEGSGGAPVEGWLMTLTGEGRNVTLPTGADGSVTFDDLPPGTYTMTEESRDGWRPLGPTAQDITLALEDDAFVTFRNQQLATLRVEKVTTLSGEPDPSYNGGWIFEVTSTCDDLTHTAQTVQGDHVGVAVFEDLLPCDGYTIEELQAASELWHPVGPTTISGVALGAGETVTVQFTNNINTTPPGANPIPSFPTITPGEPAPPAPTGTASPEPTGTPGETPSATPTGEPSATETSEPPASPTGTPPEETPSPTAAEPSPTGTAPETPAPAETPTADSDTGAGGEAPEPPDAGSGLASGSGGTSATLLLLSGIVLALAGAAIGLPRRRSARP